MEISSFRSETILLTGVDLTLVRGLIFKKFSLVQYSKNSRRDIVYMAVLKRGTNFEFLRKFYF